MGQSKIWARWATMQSVQSAVCMVTEKSLVKRITGAPTHVGHEFHMIRPGHQQLNLWITGAYLYMPGIFCV